MKPRLSWQKYFVKIRLERCGSTDWNFSGHLSKFSALSSPDAHLTGNSVTSLGYAVL